MLNSEVRTKVGGWTRVAFVDAVAAPCFLQASGSYMAGPSLVLGRLYESEQGQHYVETVLDQRSIRELLPLLQHFAEHGDLP